MHHISVHINYDSNSEDSFDEFESLLDNDAADKDVFIQMWNFQSNSFNDSEKNKKNYKDSLDIICNVYKHMKLANTEISFLKSLIAPLAERNTENLDIKNSVTLSNNKGLHRRDHIRYKVLKERREQLERTSDFLMNSAKSLRERVMKSRQYFRDVGALSLRFPVTVLNPMTSESMLAINTSIYTKEYILLAEKDNVDLEESGSSVEWKLSTDAHFSFNNKSFQINTDSNYLRYFFQLMCHQLFERIKEDKIKSSIHYSAEKNTRSVYFDIGNVNVWVFELGLQKEIGDIPVWMPKLIKYILDPRAQPATYMRQLIYFKTTLESMKKSFISRFARSDFCTLTINSYRCSAGFQISSRDLQIPYLAYVDEWRISMTETPNEMRCIPYTTDGRGLTPALEKWCDMTFGTLFLSMAERITRSFGYVFKNKNQYGTASVNSKKIKFKPLPKSNEVDIYISSHSTRRCKWSDISGSTYEERMKIILFSEFN